MKNFPFDVFLKETTDLYLSAWDGNTLNKINKIRDDMFRARNVDESLDVSEYNVLYSLTSYILEQVNEWTRA